MKRLIAIMGGVTLVIISVLLIIFYDIYQQEHQMTLNKKESTNFIVANDVKLTKHDLTVISKIASKNQVILSKTESYLLDSGKWHNLYFISEDNQEILLKAIGLPYEVNDNQSQVISTIKIIKPHFN